MNPIDLVHFNFNPQSLWALNAIIGVASVPVRCIEIDSASHLCLAGRCRAPNVQQSLPFRLAADHGSSGGLSHGRRLGDPSYLAGVNGEHALVDSLGGRTGINSQLMSQNRGARVIDAQRTGPIAHGEVQKHQLAVDGLVQRVSPYQSLRVPQRFLVLVLLLQQRCQLPVSYTHLTLPTNREV